MIAVTQCPHCQTTFRVTDDQLKLYDGAVRCGVCQQVFNGKDHLLADKNPSRPPSVPAAPEKKAGTGTHKP